MPEQGRMRGVGHMVNHEDSRSRSLRAIGSKLPGDGEPGGSQNSSVRVLVDKILSFGVDGLGPLKSARHVAEEHLSRCGDADIAIDRLIATHTRLVTATGFAMGLGGPLTLPVAVPADLTVFYALSARCAAGVAELRGYDINSDEVRSVVLLTLLGSAGAAIAADLGVQIGNKAAMAALRKLPGRVLIDINQRVCFRLLTKFGEHGLINLVKFVPLVGGGVGAGVNAGAMRVVGRYAKNNFPKVGDVAALAREPHALPLR